MRSAAGTQPEGTRRDLAGVRFVLQSNGDVLFSQLGVVDEAQDMSLEAHRSIAASLERSLRTMSSTRSMLMSHLPPVFREC